MEWAGTIAAIELTAAWRRKDARKYLLQPDITVRNLGPAHDMHQQFFSRIEVLRHGKKLATLEVVPDMMEEILSRTPREVSEFRTTLCRAMNQVAPYQVEVLARQEAETAELGEKLKSAVKWLFTPPK